MLRHRLFRAYTVLALGGILFLFWPMVLHDPLGGTLPFGAAIALRTRFCLNGTGPAYCIDAFVLAATVAATVLALVGRNLRQVLPSVLLLLPPLLFYLFHYPFWIIAALLILAPLLIHAVLNTWFEPS